MFRYLAGARGGAAAVYEAFGFHLLDGAARHEVFSGALDDVEIAFCRLGAQRRWRKPATEEQPAGFGKRDRLVFPDIHRLRCPAHVLPPLVARAWRPAGVISTPANMRLLKPTGGSPHTTRPRRTRLLYPVSCQ